QTISYILHGHARKDDLPDQNLDLGIDALLLLGGLSNEGKGTNTLTVETHILGEGLAKSNWNLLVDKLTESQSILVSVARSESLVSHVEEGEVTSLLDLLCDLGPLLWGWVDTGWVVSASVEEEDGILWCGTNVLKETVDVKTNGLLVIVSVGLNLQVRVIEDSLVVGPRWVWQVDSLGIWVVTLEESTTNSEST